MTSSGATIDRSPARPPQAAHPLHIDRPVEVPPPLPSSVPIIVTIDGPAGTGKSSVARVLAARLGLDFLDTGSMYRAAAAVAIDHGIWNGSVAGTDLTALLDAVRRADLHFDWAKDPPTVLAFGTPVDRRIRDADVTAIVSPIAGIRELREHMVLKQRIIGGQHPRLVTEGRDQGSVVFPDAAVKFYLDAAPRVRAKRRADEIEQKQGVRISDEQRAALEREIVDRDRSDCSREVGPLVRPHGAEVVDTSDMTLEQVVTTLEKYVRTMAGRMISG